MDTNKFTVADTSGNVATAGTLDVTGASTLSSTLDVTGDTSVSTFDSSGATSLATGGGVVNVASSGEMTTVKGTLNVDEAVTLDTTLDVTGNTTFAGTVTAGNLLSYGDGTNVNTFIQGRSSAGYYSGIKLARGAGNWSNDSNNHFGMVVTDNGLELAKFTALGDNATGKAVYMTMAEGGNTTFSADVTAGSITDGTATLSSGALSGVTNITASGELDAVTLDISGNGDIDGTLETDALSINGTTVTSTAAELNYVDGVTSNVQTQLNTISSSAVSSINGLSDALVESNSIYIGNDPSSTTDSATANIAVGPFALDAITTGDYNTAVGYDALTSNTTGNENTAVGPLSLISNTTGNHNTALEFILYITILQLIITQLLEEVLCIVILQVIVTQLLDIMLY